MDILVKFFRLANYFFDFKIRETQSNIITFIWMSSVLFGWVKIIFIFLNAIEYFTKHFRWG